GDGPERPDLERQATRIEDRCRSVSIKFTGWLDQAHLSDLMRTSDLLVVPSWWPEPFGLVGLETGTHQLPAAAFAVGGIPEWLIDGVNGHLAPGESPTAAGLADAISRCLRDPAEHERLRDGALAVARRYTAEKHLDTLSGIFAEVAGTRCATPTLYPGL